MQALRAAWPARLADVAARDLVFIDECGCHRALTRSHASSMKESNGCGRRYDREFKENAVGLVRGGRSISQVSRDLGVSQWSVGRWVQAAKGGHHQSEPKTLAAESDEAREMRRLRQEVHYLREQRDVLKKALGILSAEMPGRATR